MSYPVMELVRECNADSDQRWPPTVQLEVHIVYASGDVIASVTSRKTSAEGRVLQISVTPPDE